MYHQSVVVCGAAVVSGLGVVHHQSDVVESLCVVIHQSGVVVSHHQGVVSSHCFNFPSRGFKRAIKDLGLFFSSVFKGFGWLSCLAKFHPRILFQIFVSSGVQKLVPDSLAVGSCSAVGDCSAVESCRQEMKTKHKNILRFMPMLLAHTKLD